MSEPIHVGDGVISEAEAAKQGPVDGEKIANERAAEHRKQKHSVGGTPVIDEADAVKEPADKAERAANERAAAFRGEKYPDPWTAHVTTEPEVAAEVPDTAKQAEKAEKDAQPARTTQDSKPRAKRSK